MGQGLYGVMILGMMYYTTSMGELAQLSMYQHLSAWSRLALVTSTLGGCVPRDVLQLAGTPAAYTVGLSAAMSTMDVSTTSMDRAPVSKRESM